MEVWGTGRPLRSDNNERSDIRVSGRLVAQKKKLRTGKRLPNNRRFTREPPLGLNLVHHEPARLIDKGSVQRRVLRENKPHSHYASRGSSRINVQAGELRQVESESPAVPTRWRPHSLKGLVLILTTP